MYCPSCGSSIEAQARFCPNCGKVPAPGGGEDRVAKHRQLLSVLWLVAGVLRLLYAVVLCFLPQVIHASIGGSVMSPEVVVICYMLAALLFARGVAALATGWGLYYRETWGRMLALIMGFLALPILPLLTALGIYTLWVLLPRESAVSYSHLAHAESAAA